MNHFNNKGNNHNLIVVYMYNYMITKRDDYVITKNCDKCCILIPANYAYTVNAMNCEL